MMIEMREKNWHRRNDCKEKKQKGSEMARNQRKAGNAREENRDSFFFNSFFDYCLVSS